MRALHTAYLGIIHRCIQKACDKAIVHRLSALGALAFGNPVTEVAKWYAVSRQTIHNWEDRFLRSQCDPNSLADLPREGRPSHWNSKLISFLRESLDCSPQQMGYPQVNWTIGLLQEHLANHVGRWFSDDSVRRQLHAMGFVWKRARYVLEPDPDKEKKTRNPETTAAIGRKRSHTIRG